MIDSSDAYRLFGNPYTVWDEGLYMTIWNVPEYITQAIPAIPRRIYCHRQMVQPLEMAFRYVIYRGLADQIKTWDGCFQVRPIRGYAKTVNHALEEGRLKDAMRYMSIHSWGLAIDINAAWNGLGREPEMSEELVKCFEDAGFDWGGRWARKDGMHFQLSEIKPM